MIYFDNVQFDENNDFSHIIINVRKLKFEALRFQVEKSTNIHVSKHELICHTCYSEIIII